MKKLLMIIIICMGLVGCGSKEQVDKDISESTIENYETETELEISNFYIELNSLKTNIKKCETFKEIKICLSEKKDVFEKFSSLNIVSDSEVGKCVENIRNFNSYKIYESDYVTLKVLGDIKDELMEHNLLIQGFKDLFIDELEKIMELIPTEYTENAKSVSANVESYSNSNSSISGIEQKADNKVDYIKNFLSLDSATVKICEGYSGKEAGLTDVSIKNNGDKNIEDLTVTVYFQDKNGKDVAENSFLIIGGLFGGDTLKANYSWKMETDKYYSFENLSDEVDITRNRVEISDIKFGE